MHVCTTAPHGRALPPLHAPRPATRARRLRTMPTRCWTMSRLTRTCGGACRPTPCAPAAARALPHPAPADRADAVPMAGTTSGRQSRCPSCSRHFRTWAASSCRSARCSPSTSTGAPLLQTSLPALCPDCHLTRLGRRYVASRGLTPRRPLADIIATSPCHKGRLLHYLPLSRGDAAAAERWCGVHTDHGSLTGVPQSDPCAATPLPGVIRSLI